MYRQSKKKLLSSNISARSHNMAKFGPLTGEIRSGVWDNPANFNGFCVLASFCVLLYIGSVTARHSSSGISQTLWRCTRNESTELSQRVPPIFSWVAITLDIGHILDNCVNQWPVDEFWNYLCGKPNRKGQFSCFVI